MPPKGSKKIAIAKSNGKSKQVEELITTNVKKIPRSGRLQKKAENEEIQEVEPVLDKEAVDAVPKKENGANKEISTENNPDVSEENGKVEELEETTSVPTKRGNKKGVKKLADAKSNGKNEQVEELAATNVKKIPKSGRLRKMAEDEELQDVKPVVGNEAIDTASIKENEAEKEASTDNKPSKSANGEVEEPEETTAVLTKRGLKKVKAQTSAQDKNAKTNEISCDEVTSTEASDKVVESENPAIAEPEKIAGKRGRKKAVDPLTANQDQAEEINVKQEVEPVAGPSKRSKKIKQDAVVKESVADIKDKDDGDFAPRKTRGVRNAKDSAKEVATVAKGRKRKVIDEKVKVKDTKKGKVVEEAVQKGNTVMQVDDNRQLRVDIQRNSKLDEMAKNSSKEAEEIEGDMEGDSKLKEAKGDEKSKSGRKRVNKNVGNAKPSKALKGEVTERKGAGKKELEAPDTTSYDFENSSKSPDGKPWNFKIVSWNVNGIRAWLEKDGLNYLHVEQPDVLCLQETKCSKAKLPSELEEIEGYHGHWLAADKEGYSGVGILYKKKPISIKDGIGIEEHDNEGRVVTAEFENFYLVTTYVPNAARGLTRLDYRMKWDNDFRAYIKQLDGNKPVILCGDLNVAHEEIDIANPKGNKKNAGFTKEERDGFSTLLSEGFVDTFRHLYPDTKEAYTFWTYMMNARAKNVGWRIDYFVISKRFTDHLCDSAIRKNVFGSDHCPIVLFLHV